MKYANTAVKPHDNYVNKYFQLSLYAEMCKHNYVIWNLVFIQIHYQNKSG